MLFVFWLVPYSFDSELKRKPYGKSNCCRFKIYVTYEIEFRFPVKRQIKRNISEFIIQSYYALGSKIYICFILIFGGIPGFNKTYIAATTIKPLKTFRTERLMYFIANRRECSSGHRTKIKLQRQSVHLRNASVILNC